MRRNYSSYIKRRLRMYLALSPFYSPKTSKSKSTPQFLHRIFILTAIILTGINYASVAIPKKFLFAPGCINVKRQTDKSRSAVKHQNPPRFVLYRLIGNNMPPLQCPSQLLWNTEYTLKYESDFPSCKKRWVINQIINQTDRALILDSLLSYGYTMDDIIFRQLNVSKLLKSPKSEWVDLVTAQNEGRNAAISDGIQMGARWILPFDGNHFITEEAWRAFVHSADEAERKDYKYFKVPVHRVHSQQNISWLNSSSTFQDVLPHVPFMIESQLAFRNDSSERFREGMIYGQQNKLEMLNRVCGSPKDPQYKESCECGDLGVEGQLHKSNVSISKKCGYSLRLWFYPCSGTDPQKVFNRGLYRKRMRASGRKEMFRRIKDFIREASSKL